MDKENLWKALVARNPELGDDEATVTVKVSTLRRMVEQSHEQGAAECRKTHEKPREVGADFDYLRDLFKTDKRG